IGGLSKRQMERRFQAEQDCSPLNFYLLLRLERAEQLLTYTAMTVRDVGLACGFASMAQFSRQYKAHHGFPPSQTRRVG
ncbi:MAG: helix-turn-helix domain-containing protein, partial [Rhizobiales bacterium]|nr:helix-turn-helix domain-containing protein [Hyphomicrobiales bacterium]